MAAGTLDEAIEYASSLGLNVEERPLEGLLSAVLLPEGVILLNSLRSVLTRKVAVAHECGHWHYGHDWRHQHDQPRDERQANLFAAKVLIDPLDYAYAELLHDGNKGNISKEIGVPLPLIELWLPWYAGELTGV